MADVTVDLENKNSKELLNQGIRAYVLQDFTNAVQALSKASELLVAEHNNDLHDSLGEVYFYYGKSLLGLTRQEANPLGDAIPSKVNEGEGSSDDADAGEVEEDEEEEDDAPEDDAKGGDGAEDENAEGANGDVEEKVGTTNGEVSDKEENGAGPSSATESAQGDNTDEPTDLQVAWEVLELAKTIYEKRGESGRQRLAECLTTLGEISLEGESFDNAINDIKQGLLIQQELFPNDSRKVAETFYNLGVAHSTNSQIDEAIECFRKSVEYLKNRIASLVKEEKSQKNDEEVEEIKELLPDLEDKIADMKSFKEEALKTLEDLTKSPALISSSANQSSSSKPVTNISHLVKRKRKPDEESAPNEIPAKKPSP